MSDPKVMTFFLAPAVLRRTWGQLVEGPFTPVGRKGNPRGLKEW